MEFGEWAWQAFKRLMLVVFLLALVALVIFVLIADVMLGEVGISEIIKRGCTVGIFSLSQVLVSTCISIAGTAIRFCLWEMKFQGRKTSAGTWVLGLILVVLNTAVDVAAVSHVVFHAAPGQIWPAHTNGAWAFMALIIAAVCTMDCFWTSVLIKWLLRINEASGGQGMAAFLATVCVSLVMIVRSMIMLTGIMSVLLIDIIIGAAGLGSVIHYGASVPLGPFRDFGVSASTICLGFSAGTSAIQLTAWETIFQRGRHPFWSWTMMMAMILVDTMIDVSVIGYFYTGKIAVNILVPHPPPLYLVVVGIVALLALCDTYFLVFLVDALSDDPEVLFEG